VVDERVSSRVPDMLVFQVGFEVRGVGGGSDFGVRVSGSGFEVRIWGFRFRVLGVGFRGTGFRCGVSGVGCRVSGVGTV